jgi:hypothetical protein
MSTEVEAYRAVRGRSREITYQGVSMVQGDYGRTSVSEHTKRISLTQIEMAFLVALWDQLGASRVSPLRIMAERYWDTLVEPTFDTLQAKGLVDGNPAGRAGVDIFLNDEGIRATAVFQEGFPRNTMNKIATQYEHERRRDETIALPGPIKTSPEPLQMPKQGVVLIMGEDRLRGYPLDSLIRDAQRGDLIEASDMADLRTLNTTPRITREEMETVDKYLQESIREDDDLRQVQGDLPGGRRQSWLGRVSASLRRLFR